MLYIVGTSIGNIKDTSYRAVETLVNADHIYAEDTRTFSPYYERIQELYGFLPKKNQKVSSLHDKNEFQQLPEVLSQLTDNKDVVIVSESGMPAISDPGKLVIDHAQKNRIPYTVIPGPTAYTTALVMSGLISDKHTFIGFLPKKDSHKKKLFASFTQDPDTILVAYESPHRLGSTLHILEKEHPDAQVAICRELTKKFEEVVRGTPSELINQSYKGEITLVIRMAQ